MKTLETKRLILREWNINDAEDLYNFAKSPLVGPMAGWKPHVDVDESLKIIEMFIKEDDTWAIVDKETNKVIGGTGLHNDGKRKYKQSKMIGYVLSEEYWGRGLVAESTQRILKYGFEELELEIISIYHFPFNVQSKRVIEKCKFTYEGVMRKAGERFDKVVLDDVCYSMTKEEYFNIYTR